MKYHKIGGLFVALLLCVSAVIGASAVSADVEERLAYTLETDAYVEQLGNTVAKTGDTITVTLKIAENPGFLVANGQVEFDAQKLRLVSTEVLAEGFQINAVKNADGLLKFMYGDVEKALKDETYPSVTGTGAMAKLEFLVLQETDAVVQITLSTNRNSVLVRNAATGKPGAAKYGVEGAMVQMHLVGGDHIHTNYQTVEAGNGVLPTCAKDGKETDLLCSYCGETVQYGKVLKATGDHVYDMEKGVVTKSPTCAMVGEKSYYCGCGAVRTETVAATGIHRWDSGKITTEPTCDKAGVRTFTCTVCGDRGKTESVAATGAHSWDAGTVTVEPSAEKEGVRTFTCTVCGDVKTESIAKLTEEGGGSIWPYVLVGLIVLLIAVCISGYVMLKPKRPEKF